MFRLAGHVYIGSKVVMVCRVARSQRFYPVPCWRQIRKLKPN